MTRCGAAIALALLAAAPLALSAGCALFMDLNSEPYRQSEAGPGESTCALDAGDGGCAILSLSETCSSDCPSGEACCVTANLSGSLVDGSLAASCRTPSACASLANSFQICASSTECGDGGSCIAQTCSLGGPSVTVRACARIPLCTTQ
jgi:hypothetical protein